MDSRSIWTSCFVLIIASSSIINIRIHEIVHPFIIDKLWTKLLYYNLPVIFLLITYFLTALGTSIEPVTIADSTFLELKPPQNLLGTNVAFKDNWILFLSALDLIKFWTKFGVKMTFFMTFNYA